MFYFRIFKVYLKTFVSNNDINEKLLQKKNLRRLFIHLFKSDFLILWSIKAYFNFINILSIILKFKKLYNIDSKSGILFLSFINKIFFIYTKKLNELIFAVAHIQDERFNQKSQFYKLKNSHLNYRERYDAIIIGSGPSGSITANYLKKKFNKVLIIEKGNAFKNYNTKHPGEEFIHKWNNAGINTTLFGNQVSFSSGSCLGGGSEINSGLIHFPDDLFINKWKNDYDVSDLDLIKINEDLNNLIIQNVPASLTEDKDQSLAAKLFLKGIKKNQIKFEELKKFESQSNSKNLKSSMTETLLKEYIKSEGQILVRCNIDKIVKNNSGWKISGIKNKLRMNFETKYLFLCAGSIYTNQLLIKNKLCSTNAVNSFKFHPMIKVIAEYDKPIQTGRENVHNIQITENYPDFLIGQAASSYQFLKFAAYEDKKLLKEIENKWRNMSIYHSTFSIGAGKINKFLNNKFIYSYKISDDNINLLKNALSSMVKVIYSSGAKRVYFLGKKITLMDSNYENIINSNLTKINDFKFSSVHIMGGVKSGEKKSCIVNSFGELKNHKNIFINDSSLINHKLLKNPQGTTMALSQRNIKNFLSNV